MKKSNTDENKHNKNMDENMALKTGDLSVGYDGKALIRDIALNVKPGKIVALIGPNGAGKSTVLKTVAGHLKPVYGEVYLSGKSLSKMNSSEISSEMAVMMTERFNAEYATCFDVVSIGRYRFTSVLGRLDEKDVEAIDSALKFVGAYELKRKTFDRLSDGQKQRVLLARAIAQETGSLVLDEPTGFLDISHKLEFMDNLKRLVREKNIAVLLSIHEPELVKKLADLVVCIKKDGEIDRIDTPENVFKGDYIKTLFDVRSESFDEVYGFLNRGENKSETDTEGKDICKSNLDPASKTKFLMVQGTMSGAGKSLLVAGLCRVLKQDGYKVSPFKSQNMALNSYVTEDGLEMGRAQVMQAEAAGIKPSVYMNPILLKPNSDVGSQVIVNGKVLGNMKAREYFKYKKSLVPEILHAVDKLKEEFDIVIIEGAGSPAEINLKENDIVNMGMAALVDAPVLLVGDIDRGGVFAQLLGTLELLEEDEKARVKGLVVNKFRGDKSILDPGIEMLENMGKVPVAGVVPYMRLSLEDEDSLTERFEKKKKAEININVIRLPHISNFTDFDVFEQVENVALNYITKPEDLEWADLCIIPGTKNTIGDMKWLKESGFEAAIMKYVSSDKPLIGICGGYQILGSKILDPENVEGGGSIDGLSLLPLSTRLGNKKHRELVSGKIKGAGGIFSGLSGKEYSGYEIHMGDTDIGGLGDNEISDPGEVTEFTDRLSGYCRGNIYGTYVHGFFDEKDIVTEILKALSKEKGIDFTGERIVAHKDLKEREYDRLADTLREYMDMELVYDLLGIGNRKLEIRKDDKNR
ncbi:MAG: cobyric acid synthase [Lachnospiraceae bacterium]|nr:cobyric acid synthase [Lachnospiraceae bacterium]